MSEITKHLERAEKYLQKGKLTSALDEFRELLLEDPTNDFARQRAADLCQSLNMTGEAMEHLGAVFDHAVDHNRQPEAIQTYKKLQRLGAVKTERTYRYALLVDHSSPREALEAFKSAFHAFKAKGDKQQALAAVKRMVAHDPSAENYRAEAELSVDIGESKTAAAAYLQLGRIEDGAGHDPSGAYEHAYLLDPQSPAISLAHARCLMRGSRADKAVEVLQAQPSTTVEYFDTFAHALLMSNQLEAAEPVVLKFYEMTPMALPVVGELLNAYVQAGRAQHAVGVGKSLEPLVRSRSALKDYIAIIKELSEKSTSGTEFLEYLAHLYNSSNREHEYCDTLLKLFELHFAQRNFTKAAECLDRASEVDAYESGHQERLELLRGKIDNNKFNTISNRLTSVARTQMPHDEDRLHVPEPEPEKQQEPTVLEDLMLQAEIFLQYSMRSKAAERLERINKLFPREEEKREKLAHLYATAGFIPKYEDVRPVAEARVGGAGQGADESAVDNFTRVTEITRNISRQSSVKAVLFATVNDVGRHWNVSRCVAGLCAPGKAPSAAMEYCAPGVTKSDVMGLARLISTLQGQAVKAGGSVRFENAQKAPELETLRPVLVAQKIESLIAVPLREDEEHIGIVVLEHCSGMRNFRNVDEVVLNTIGEQIVQAVNNARLRSLVKTLAVTDEKSGLLRRSSYLDVLLAEVQRSLQQGTPVTIVLMKFGSVSALIKEFGEERVDGMMQEIGHVVTANIRQNDMAARYDLTGIVLILSDTNDKSSFFVLDKLRKSLGGIHLPGRNDPVTMTAGIAELVMQPRYDPVDIVTEGINRVESALEIARHEGGDRAHAMAPMFESVVTA